MKHRITFLFVALLPLFGASGCFLSPDLTPEIEAIDRIGEIFNDTIEAADTIVENAEVDPPEAKDVWRAKSAQVKAEANALIEKERELLIERGRVDWKTIARRARDAYLESRR